MERIRTVSMPEMNPDTAALFLMQRAQRSPSDAAEKDEARQLAAALGRSPLLMELAANNLAAESFRSFREEFLRLREEIFSGLKDKTLAGTLALYKRIRQRLTPPGKALLGRMAFLNPDAMQETVFKQIFHANPNAVPHVLADLKRVSLVQPTAEGGVWRMHRLVQEAVKYQMSPENRVACATQTIQALEKLLPPPTSDDWRKIEPLLAHSFVIAETVGRYNIRSVEGGDDCCSEPIFTYSVENTGCGASGHCH